MDAWRNAEAAQANIGNLEQKNDETIQTTERDFREAGSSLESAETRLHNLKQTKGVELDTKDKQISSLETSFATKETELQEADDGARGRYNALQEEKKNMNHFHESTEAEARK